MFKYCMILELSKVSNVFLANTVCNQSISHLVHERENLPEDSNMTSKTGASIIDYF